MSTTSNTDPCHLEWSAPTKGPLRPAAANHIDDSSQRGRDGNLLDGLFCEGDNLTNESSQYVNPRRFSHETGVDDPVCVCASFRVGPTSASAGELTGVITDP